MFISSVRYLCGTYILTEDEHFGSFLFEVSFYTIIRTLSVNAVGYQDEILAIYFTNGSLYYYLAVPELIFNNLLEASCKGLFIMQNIKNKFVAKQIL